MEIRSFGARGALRVALSLFIVGGASLAFAQSSIRSMPPTFYQHNTKHAAGKKVTVQPVDQIDTHSFFPQIDRTVGQRGFKPKPREDSRGIPTGAPTGLTAGGLDGNAKVLTGPLFPGINSTGWIPPDCTAAVGTTHVVQGVNSSFAFFTKAGNQTFLQGSNQFFAGTGASSFQFDPRVVYDHYNDRFIMTMLAQDDNGSVSQILIAVSDDGDPNGSWTRYVFDSSVDDDIADSWLDYHQIGFTADALVISGNMFSFAASQFTAMQSWVIPTAPLYAGAALTATPFTITGQGFNTRPGITFTPGATTLYGISLNTTSSVRLWAYTALDTATPALTSTVVNVQSYGNIGAAPSGGAGVSDSLSGRTMDAVSRGSSFLSAHTVVLSGDNKSSVRWYEFNMGSWPTSGTPTVAQQGNITLGSGQWAYMPAISMNSFGDVSVLFTRSSTAIFGDLLVASRTAGDPPGTLSTPTLLRGSLAANFQFRWGDYFTIGIDPTDDATFWGNGEVVGSNGNWSTEIASWTVTTGGGGGGGGVDYDPTAIAAFMGVYNAGGIPEVMASDNLFFDVQSVVNGGLGHFAAAQMDYVIVEPSQSVSSLTLKIEANCDPGVTATGMVFLWDWTTNQFEYANAFTIEKLGNNINLTKITDNPGQYVSNTGQVRAVFRAHEPFRRRGALLNPFRMRLDLAKLTIVSS